MRGNPATTKKQEDRLSGNKSASSRPLWSSLGAKFENKSPPWEMGGRVSAGALRFVMLLGGHSRGRKGG